ncbi:MAG: hypothetical protein P8J87_00835, partial [Verrucomicrobiales bacterium]|nr:hypothetical protein [Verrucomicrobiales bacterium]
VGYPERISLAFDTEEMAIRLLWKGEFASVNHGSFRARGGDRIAFPAGIPFHRLGSLDDAWPYKGKTDYLFPQDHGYQYRGYTLDKQKRPTFNYHYGEIAVTDYFEDHLDGEGNAYFRRTLTFTTPEAQAPFYFRAASGKEIKPAGPDWQIDRLTLKIPNQPTKIRQGDPMELLLPITLAAGTTTLSLDYHW